jgi:hypothetical protein
MADQFYTLDDDVVVKIEEKLNYGFYDLVDNKSYTFEVNELHNAVFDKIKGELDTEESKLFIEAIEAKVIGFQGGGWKKGKVKCKLVLEFCPYEPIASQTPSPLDEIRKSLEN